MTKRYVPRKNVNPDSMTLKEYRQLDEDGKITRPLTDYPVGSYTSVKRDNDAAASRAFDADDELDRTVKLQASLEAARQRKLIRLKCATCGLMPRVYERIECRTCLNARKRRQYAERHLRLVPESPDTALEGRLSDETPVVNQVGPETPQGHTAPQPPKEPA